MSSDRHSPVSASPADRRRSSITGHTFQDLFGRGSGSGSMASAAVNAQRRRLSLTTVGLGAASPNHGSTNPRPRTESLSSANSGSVDENPFDDDAAPPSAASSTTQGTPFGRRLSFGARALRDVRAGNGALANPNGTSSSSSSLAAQGAQKASPAARDRGPSPSPLVPVPAPAPPSQGDPVRATVASRSLVRTGDGYNFADTIRSRAERSSMSSAHPGYGVAAAAASQPHQRAKSVAVPEPPVREVPKQAKMPDAYQERILKGDFYMD